MPSVGLQESEEEFAYRIGKRAPSISARLAGKLAFWKSKPFKIPADIVSDHHRDNILKIEREIAELSQCDQSFLWICVNQVSTSWLVADSGRQHFQAPSSDMQELSF